MRESEKERGRQFVGNDSSEYSQNDHADVTTSTAAVKDRGERERERERAREREREREREESSLGTIP